MPFEIIEQSPELSDYVPLSEHESQTPGTFFGGKPVLHLYAPAAKLKIPSAHVAEQTDIRKLADIATPPSNVNGPDVSIDDIDVWVTSRSLNLFSRARSFGLSISYPTISVTALDGQDVLLELNLSDPNINDDDDIVHMHMRIAADTVQHSRTANGNDDVAQRGQNGGAGGDRSSAGALFRAISDCQDLNPDPEQDDSDDFEGGDFDETAPGATGWITSENMADFMDEEGNLRMPNGMTVIGGGANGEDESLGAGAGRARTAAEMDVEDGGAQEGEESKWQRTG